MLLYSNVLEGEFDTRGLTYDSYVDTFGGFRSGKYTQITVQPSSKLRHWVRNFVLVKHIERATDEWLDIYGEQGGQGCKKATWWGLREGKVLLSKKE